MKTLTIGSTNLELISFRKIRDKVVGVYAQIEIPTTAISHDELKALFTDNQYDLIVTEEDGSTATYSGYVELDEIREKGGVYTVIQICTSEVMHLLNEARNQISKLEEENSTLKMTVTQQSAAINEQGTAINNHAKAITEQSQTIAAQTLSVEAVNKRVATLEESGVGGTGEAAWDEMAEAITEGVDEV